MIVTGTKTTKTMMIFVTTMLMIQSLLAAEVLDDANAVVTDPVSFAKEEHEVINFKGVRGNKQRTVMFNDEQVKEKFAIEKDEFDIEGDDEFYNYNDGEDIEYEYDEEDDFDFDFDREEVEDNYDDNDYYDEKEDYDNSTIDFTLNSTISTERRLDDKKTCKLKLYWKKGYFWQEEKRERKWCVQDSSGRAKIKKCRDTKRQEWILNEDDNTIRKKSDDDKCLEVRDNKVYVKDCKSSGSARSRQKFDFDFSKDKFEIKRAGRCMTQQHHPRENEKCKMQRCGEARRDKTSLWECDD